MPCTPNMPVRTTGSAQPLLARLRGQVAVASRGVVAASPGSGAPARRRLPRCARVLALTAPGPLTARSHRSGGDVQREQFSRACSSSVISPSRLRAELHVHDLVVQLEDRVQQHLRPRRAAGQVDVDRHDVVDALHDRVVVEHAAGRRADAHGDDPLGLGHLVVDLPQHRRHLLADPAGDDHQVGLRAASTRVFSMPNRARS